MDEWTYEQCAYRPNRWGRSRSRSRSISRSPIREAKKSRTSCAVNELTEILKTVQPPGGYCTFGTIKTLPGLVVNGIGDVGLPLSGLGARELIKHSRPLTAGSSKPPPKAWRLDHTQFQLQNTEWQAALQLVMAKARGKLGISQSAAFAATLSRLVLVGPGGCLEKTAPVHSNPKTFASMLLVLPSRFDGGTLSVQHPAEADKKKPYVWNMSSENLYTVKYAAFYGDCEHEVSHVEKGFFICLVYDLVSRDTELPRFGGESFTFSTLRTMLKWFFVMPQRRLRHPSSRLNNHEWDPADTLVYVVQSKYDSSEIAYDQLRGRDRSVLECFTRICDDSGGAMILYLCSTEKDKMSSYPFLTVKAPWIRHGTNKACPFGSIYVDGHQEVVPSGWHESPALTKTPALVILTVRKEMSLSLRAGVSFGLEKLEELGRVSGTLARQFAQMLFSPDRSLTMTPSLFEKTMALIQLFGDIETMQAVLSSLSGFEFTPRLGVAARKLGWDSSQPDAARCIRRLDQKSQVNVICSILTDCDDRAQQIATLDLLSQVPRGDPFGTTEVTMDELARLLALASNVSIDRLLLCLNVHASLVRVIVPAFLSIVSQLKCPRNTALVAQTLLDRVQAERVSLDSRSQGHVDLGCKCTGCYQVEHFLYCSAEAVLRLRLGAWGDKHIKDQLARHVPPRATVSVALEAPKELDDGADRGDLDRDEAPRILVLTKRTPDDPLRAATAHAIRELSALVAKAPPPPPPVAM